MSRGLARLTLISIGIAAAALSGACSATSIQPLNPLAGSVREQTAAFSVLYTFAGGTNGYVPVGGLVRDASGAFYGTTYFGGANQRGTVYKLTPAGSGFTQSILYSFAGGSDGAFPTGSLTIDRTGALYGTTLNGGSSQCEFGNGCGTVFRLTPSVNGYTESVLHRFSPNSGGYNPYAGVVVAKNGALYGTAAHGGLHLTGAYCNTSSSSSGCGVVYELAPSGSSYAYRVLYSFGKQQVGFQPVGGLTAGARGVLYGTAQDGGNFSGGAGTVFSLTPSGTKYRFAVLHFFKDTDGAFPQSTLVAGAGGTLFGTTAMGGRQACSGGCGTVFELLPAGSKYTLRTLHSFDGKDGSDPAAGVTLGTGGVLYGTAAGGGSLKCHGGKVAGCGVLFELVPSGKIYVEKTLYQFGNTTSGFYPSAGLIFAAGKVFGVAEFGGASPSTCVTSDRCGTVFAF